MNKLDELLMNYNILPGHLGYDYIKWALKTEKNNISMISLTKLYRDIAIEFNSTASRVERAMRYAFSRSKLKDYTNTVGLAILQLAYTEGND